MSDSNTPQFNDAQWTAWAYINDVRHVEPKSGDAYFSISLSGVQGTKEKPIYLKIRSGNVYGEQAIGMARSLYEACKAAKTNSKKLRIFARVKLSDLTPSIYYVGDEPRISMMGRLYSITNVQVDGVKSFADLDVVELSNTTETSESEEVTLTSDSVESVDTSETIGTIRGTDGTDETWKAGISYSAKIEVAH